jgi:hypothetical protein
MNQMNQNRILNWVVIILCGCGLVALVITAAQTPQTDLIVLIRKFFSLASIPFGLLIKFFDYISKEKEKLNVRVDGLSAIVNSNRSEVDYCRVRIEKNSKDLEDLEDRTNELLGEYNRRLTIHIAQTGLQSKIGELELRQKEIEFEFLKKKGLTDS